MPQSGGRSRVVLEDEAGIALAAEAVASSPSLPWMEMKTIREFLSRLAARRRESPPPRPKEDPAQALSDERVLGGKRHP
jgi:hypothetical protein